MMRRRLPVLVAAAALLALSLFRLLPLAAATGFADPAFSQQWNAAETTVPNFWGPLANAKDGQMEAYNGGQRLVQYFDKARMELAGPNTVTNGLLTVELISGKRQIGDTTFASYPPSNSPVAGDPGDSYLTYKALAALPAKVAQDSSPVSRVFNPDGSFGNDAALGSDPNAAFGSYQSDPGGVYGHNIPKGMWDYLQKSPVPWLGATGYPITEAFWANVKVKGVMKPVLVQAYQRRVLTYTPGNPQGFQVEMGNIGQHYYQWRYVTAPDGSNVTPTPTVTSTPTSGITVVIVSAPGAHPGNATNLTIKTAPGAICTLDYKPPGGTTSERQGTAIAADKDGMVTFSFAAGGNLKHPFPSGQGVETVTCNGITVTQTIPIG